MPSVIHAQTAAEKKKAVRRVAAGEATSLGRGFYLDHEGRDPAIAMRSSWADIAGTLFPEAVITDRSGLEGRPVADEDGARWLFLSGPYATKVHQFGELRISVRRGPGPAKGDTPFMGGTLFASRERALLDNLPPSRARSGPARTLGGEKVEHELDRTLVMSGEAGLNSLRDKARALSGLIGREEEFRRLDEKIGAALGTRTAKAESKLWGARIIGRAYDDEAIRRLSGMFSHLSVRAPHAVQSRNGDQARVAGAFFEAYFSNFIEGTRFTLGDAKEIVDSGLVPENRPSDGRDVLSTYQLFTGPRLSSLTSLNETSALDLIRGVNARLMSGRPEMRPGEFKTHKNSAGDTVFVIPDLVYGTILRGLEIIRSTDDGFARAIMTHALLTDVHPFNDGNGRTSRALMGNELECAGLSRICVPTVYRSDYIDAQRAYTRRGDPDIITRSLFFCQRVTAACAGTDFEEQARRWATAYAFCENGSHARLEMPSRKEVEWRHGVPAPVDYWEGVDGASPPINF